MATNDGGGPTPDAALQFDKADFATLAARTCTRCQKKIDDTYFTAGNHVTCESCARGLGSTGKTSDLMRAFGYGAGAAALGTLIWLLIMKLFDAELGLVAVAVGLLVGLAVRKGARGCGGPRYQAIAMVLTYVSITTSYVPFVIKGIAEKNDSAAQEKKSGDSASSEPSSPPPTESSTAGALALGLIFIFAIALAAPFLAGASNIMGLFIIGIALYEAWKVNGRIAILGPFRVGTPTGSPNATAPPAGQIPTAP